MDTVIDSVSGSGTRRTKIGMRPSWLRLYFALAAFDLLTVGVSLHLKSPDHGYLRGLGGGESTLGRPLGDV